MPLYQILLYLFIFVARCPNNPNTIIFFQSDTHLLMLFFSPWKICVFMTRQVDLLYMKHNTSFQSQVMLAATQNSNFPRGPEQFIGWFMKFSVDFHKLKNRFKITWLAVSQCLAQSLLTIQPRRRASSTDRFKENWSELRLSLLSSSWLIE